MTKDLNSKTQELQRITETLEKVEHDALITYNDNVNKFLQSEQFKRLLCERVGNMHEDDFSDFLKFVGARNVVNPALHTIDNYRDEEMKILEKEKPIFNANLKHP